jgi:excisionase family DNA binding protein
MPKDSRWNGKGEREALFVRIPADQARAIDRLAFEQRRPKQDVVSELLSHSYAELRRRVTIETQDDSGLVVGHHAFRSIEPDVLTLAEVAELLGVTPELVEGLAREGEIPGRQIGGSWRFARRGVLAWLSRGFAGEPAGTEQ